MNSSSANGTTNQLSQLQDERPRHKFAHPKGGMNLYDEGNVIPAAFKEYLGRIANKIAKA